MSVSAGVTTSFDRRTDTLNSYVAWERITTFSLVNGDTTGVAAIPMNGLLLKIIVTLSDMADAEGTTDVSLTDNGDNTIWSVIDLAESVTYTYSVIEPLVKEVNVVLAFDDPGSAGATVTVTLRGI